MSKRISAARAVAVVASLGAAVVAFGPSHAAAPPSSVAAAGPTDSYIVVFKPAQIGPASANGTSSLDEPSKRANRSAAAVGATPTHTYTHAVKGYAAPLSAAQLDSVRRDPDVAFVEPDRKRMLTAQEVPTGVRRVFGSDNAKLGIGAATDKRVDVDVAVIDSGVNDHPDLDVAGRFDCSSTGCVPGGYDVTGHGTHVAGTVAAMNNTDGVVGMAPGARLWSFKACGTESCSDSAIIAAIDAVTARADRIEVVNMSLGGKGTSQAMQNAVAAGVDAGLTFVAAAGNDGADAKDYVPSSIPDVISVSALADGDGRPGGAAGTLSCWGRPLQDDALATFSNWGSTVDIAAPGACIRSTSASGGYQVQSGTSMASPHVAGAAGLLASGPNKPRTRTAALALRSRLLAAGNKNWTAVAQGADDPQEPLLDVHDPAVFAPTLTAGPVPASWRAAGIAPGGSTRSGRAQCVGDPNGLYLFGGDNAAGTKVDSSWRYDLVSNEWKQLASMPGGPRTALAAVCTGEGTIHVVGGNAATDNHLIYNVAANTWSIAPRVPRSVNSAALGSWNGKVFVVGGQDSLLVGAPSQYVDIYDVATRAWTRSITTQPMAQIGSVQVGRYLYIAGWWGVNSPTSNSAGTLRYDLEDRSWMAGPNLPGGRYGLTLTATNQALYAIGGFSDNDVLTPTAEVTRLPLTGTFPFNAWTTVDPLPRTLGWPSAACAPTKGGVIVASVGGTSFPTSSPGWTGGVWHTLKAGESCALGDTGRWKLGVTMPSTKLQSNAETARCADAPNVVYHLEPDNPGELWSLDTRSDRWTRLADSKVQNAGLACGPGGKLHAIGDFGTMTYEVYDRATNTWSTAPAPPLNTYTTLVGAYGTKVVAVGTRPTDPSATVAQVYDTVTRTWTAGPSLPATLLGAEAVQAGKNLYVVGGVDFSRDGVQPEVWRLDMTTATWLRGPSLPAARYAPAVMATNEALYVVGGDDGSFTPTSTVYRLPLTGPGSGTWTVFPSLPMPSSQGGGWCAPVSTGGARLGLSGGSRPGVQSGFSWQTTVPETCAG